MEIPSSDDKSDEKRDNSPASPPLSEGVSDVKYAAQLRGRALVGRKVELHANVLGCTLLPGSSMPDNLKEEYGDQGPFVEIGEVEEEGWGESEAKLEE